MKDYLIESFQEGEDINICIHNLIDKIWDIETIYPTKHMFML